MLPQKPERQHPRASGITSSPQRQTMQNVRPKLREDKRRSNVKTFLWAQLGSNQ